MAGYFGGKTKRKETDEVYDEHFLFSYPATKIRRLDCELMPIIEGDEAEVSMEFDQQPAQVMNYDDIEELPYVIPAYSTSEERALVVYKPMDSRIVSFPSNEKASFKVCSELIDGIKIYGSKVGDRSIDRMDEKTAVHDNSLALVPWVPLQTFASANGCDEQTWCLKTSMDSEEPEASSMEVDDVNERVLSNGLEDDGFQQWKQHCMTPQMPPAMSTAIIWPL